MRYYTRGQYNIQRRPGWRETEWFYEGLSLRAYLQEHWPELRQLLQWDGRGRWTRSGYNPEGSCDYTALLHHLDQHFPHRDHQKHKKTIVKDIWAVRRNLGENIR